jgi:putative ABC transport system permease protein
MKSSKRWLNDLDRDIRDHVEQETRENIERGMTPDEARYAAVRKFGNITRVAEQTREVWSSVYLQQLWQDIRYGARVLRHNPGFTMVVILTLALGIGMNTALFSVVNAVLLRPVAYPNPDRLVWLGNYDPHLKRDIVISSDFVAWRAHAQSYTAMSAYSYQQIAMATPQGAANVSGVVIAGDFWAVTGARPAFGRLFSPEEQDAIVLTWDLFERDFAGDPGVVGRSVTLDGHATTVTGVLPKTFRLQFPMWWTATQPQPVEAYFPVPARDLQSFRGVQVVAALKPEVGTRQALAELEVMERRIMEEDRRSRPTRPGYLNLHVDPLQEQLVGGARPALLVLFAAGVFVLLIATVNIVNLLLARATVRRKEIAIRASVGAGRARVIRQFLTESLVLALLGGSAGLLLARGAIGILLRLWPNALPRLAEATIDGWVLAFTIAISAGAGVLFGTVPAIALWRSNLHDTLKDGARTSASSSGLRIRRLLVAGELALAIVLLTGAGLMLKSFWRMNAHPQGFAPERVLVTKVRASAQRYSGRPTQTAYLRELVQRLESVPKIEAAGVSFSFLYANAPAFPNDSLSNQTQPNQTHVVRVNAASSGFLKAVGIRLVKGRWLADTDPADNVLLNESMSRLAFGDADPIGRVLSVLQPATVVGVVADLKYSKLDAAPPAEVYMSYQQLPFFRGISVDVAARTTGDPSNAAPAVRKLIAEIDPTQPVYSMKTQEQALSDSIAPRRFNLFVLGSFAATALLLALVGIYGVIAYSVAQRTHEIGIRMALGAQRREVVGMVAREGMVIALIGLTIGLAAAVALTRLMQTMLYDVKPTDLPTFAAVTATLAATALLACWGPAVKAAFVDPIVALRHE